MLDLQPIKDRLAAATPGPWEIDDRYSDCHVGQGEKALFTVEVDAKKSDVELVACAKEDLAALVAEVERLREAIAEHRKTVEPGDDYCGADIVLWRVLDA